MKSKLLALATTTALLAAAGIAQAQETVRLGVINDRSGIYSDLGGLGSEIAVRMAVEDFGGTVLGKKIEVIGGDSQNKVDVASTMVRNWFDTQNLVAVVDGGASSTGLASVHVANEKGGSALISGGFAGDFNAEAVNQKMREIPVDSKLIKNASVRPQDGRVIMDMYQVRVKTPHESKGPNDVYNITATVPGKELFVPLSDSECPLVKKS